MPASEQVEPSPAAMTLHLRLGKVIALCLLWFSAGVAGCFVQVYLSQMPCSWRGREASGEGLPFLYHHVLLDWLCGDNLSTLLENDWFQPPSKRCFLQVLDGPSYGPGKQLCATSLQKVEIALLVMKFLHGVFSLIEFLGFSRLELDKKVGTFCGPSHSN